MAGSVVHGGMSTKTNTWLACDFLRRSFIGSNSSASSRGHLDESPSPPQHNRYIAFGSLVCCRGPLTGVSTTATKNERTK